MEHFRILPLEIKLDILSRLPTESVLECKLVCKPWGNLVCHSSFSQQHLNHLLNNDSGKSDVIFNADKPGTNSSECYCFSYNDENLSPSIRRINLTPELRSYSIVGSCNGLICLIHESLIVICNPITKEYVTLPKLEKEEVTRWKQCLLTGFGYHPVTNEYKVIRINLPNSVEVEVYTLGSGKGWRNVGKFKGWPGSFLNRLGVFANGALHWVDARKRAIVTFNLADEKLCDTPLPPISNLSSMSVILDLRVTVLGEYLMCSYHVGMAGNVDIWLLKKENGQGEEDSKSMTWSKEFSFVGKTPFAFTRSGSVLCYDTGIAHPYFYRYDLESSCLEGFMGFDSIILQSPSAHINTLVSLKALGEENTMTMESSLETKSND